MDDLLMLVDKEDNVIGYENRLLCHQGEGLLHRAFSILLFSADNELLLQKRSVKKFLWPLYWSNSVCSHPKVGESCIQGATRRIIEELGVSANLHYAFKFTYHSKFYDVGAEHEICYVFLGRVKQPLKVDMDEVAEWKFMDAEKINRELSGNPDSYTPWFINEWAQIQKGRYLEVLKDNAF